MKVEIDDTFKAFLRKYDRVYDPKANAKAIAEKVTREAAIKAKNVK